MSRFDPRLMFVTDGVDGVVETARAAVAGGATAVQVRAKDTTARRQLALLAAVVEACPDVPVLVNDRVDVLLAAREGGVPAAGVHLGQDDLPAEVARRVVGPDLLVGLTANTADHLAAVADLPAGCVDYLGVGALRATATKPDHPPTLGYDGVRAVCAQTDLPCVVIGGVCVDDVPALRDAGASGVAVVSAISGSADPAAAAADLRAAW